MLAPAPIVTVTVEQAADGTNSDEIHFHAGGQGFWIARLLGELDVDVVLCGTFAGETGRVARLLVAEEGIETREVGATGANGAYLHDRRSGERVPVANMASSPLSRHEVDELYGTVLVEALDADVCVLGGPAEDTTLPPDIYRRLAADVARNGGTVLADLSGDRLAAVLEGGVTVCKVSHEELLTDGLAEGDDVESLVAAMAAIVGDIDHEGAGGTPTHGARHVVVTRAGEPAIALIDGELIEVSSPSLEAADHRGAGDSLSAGLAAGLAHGLAMTEALRLGAAAGGLNVTRRGLATGRFDQIRRLAAHVQVRPLGAREPGRPAPQAAVAGVAR